MQVFISYRRSDSASAAGRLADGLSEKLGAESVFFDTRDLTAGMQWRDELVQRVRAADVVLTVIGPRWADAATERDRDRQRGSADQDVVRLEVEQALRYAPIVIPVLVDGATMPSRQTLARPLQPITALQAESLRSESWHQDVEALVANLATAQPPPTPPSPAAPPATNGASADPSVRRAAQYLASGSLVIVLGSRSNHADGNGGAPVDDDELARRIAEELGVDVGDRGLAWVSQQFALTDGRLELVQQVTRMIDADARPTSVHQALAHLAHVLGERGGGGLMILNANYDRALERAFDAVREPYDLAVFDGQHGGRFVHVPWWSEGEPERRRIDVPNEYVNLPVDEHGRLEHTVIVKLHGGATDPCPPEDRDNYVITEDDHIGYLSRGPMESLVPLQILRKMRESHFLFLGYPVGDWAMRVLLQRLWGEQRLQMKSWAVDPDLSAGEPELWGQLGIAVVAKPLPAYAQALQLAVSQAVP
ncbi:TIR domain-containing protein [Solirubrobacter ginsenosidimutans]|uniref:TIR domain-containing protein n=1 Tax=Solirubrobacter ginsenosidimutans TaxID=490573 RepID=A0A9X3MRB4_9ACTN|nr:TIR domain-containing protein [Solirubrobacter ginsenosidimutans]MDA0159798.1 TIR domain-containing protein [Solirubrobacter ginsenosidimutans]